MFPCWFRSWVAAFLFLAQGFLSGEAQAQVQAQAQVLPPDVSRLRRGQTLYVANCSMCHQVTGRGAAGTYPPLAGSDFLLGPEGRKKAILAVVGGLQGPIKVNGKAYNNQMPAVVLDDASVADVLTYVFNSWGNPAGSFDAAEVAAARAGTQFKTFAELVQANAYAPLPKSPEGTRLRELFRLNEFVVRIAASTDTKSLYLLAGDGAVRRLDLASRKVFPLLSPQDYIEPERGGVSATGFHVDARGRFWIVANRRLESPGPLITNEVTVYRSSKTPGLGKDLPVPWFRMQYPWGIGPYNHGASHVAIGPDGKLYLSSGSRTDGGEAGNDPRLGTMGEVGTTAALLRLDPESADPVPEVVARGLRNSWSFQWDGAGELFTVSNGPDAHACEEMDWVRVPAAGGVARHHGFPYQFENWSPAKAVYPHTPKPPEGVEFVHPVRNLGPAGLPAGRDGFTFTPHSSPAGLVWLDARWPEPWRGAFLMGRFGNLITGDGGADSGFDVLCVRPKRNPEGNWEARTTTFLAPLGRPLDLVLNAGKLYILEYTRPTDFKGGRGWLPGRILEVEPGSQGGAR